MNKTAYPGICLYGIKEGGHVMSKLIPGNQRHLTLSNRITIETMLKEKKSLKEIARELHKDPTTISKEIKLHRQFRSANWATPNSCKHKKTCRIKNLCNNRGKCYRECRTCRTWKCNSKCSDYVYETCGRLSRSPYVCNFCDKRSCRLDKYYYRAEYAHKEYEALRRESRLGINATPDQIAQMNEIITAGVKKKQSIAHIVHTNGGVIKCTEKTIYNYISGGYFSVGNIDLPRKLHYKPRKSENTKKADAARKCAALGGRRYTDFTEFMAKHDLPVTEMDTVHGAEGTQKVLLTMLSVRTGVLLPFLLEACTQDEVVRVFDEVEAAVTPDAFRKAFSVIITDRGSEFLCPELLERSITGGQRTRVFYCDPNAPFQKPHLEKSHTHIRSFFPKKSSWNNGKRNTFDLMTQEKITLMANHINSLARDSLNGLPPMLLGAALLPPELIEALGLELIPAMDVTLIPALLK
jgi:IS30 family transposase